MEAKWKMGVSLIVLGGVFCFGAVNGQEQCNGELWCEQGHCCGSDGTHCCTYYYELWWFWMIWGLIIMLSCCCLYQQHRLKKRQRRALRALQTGLRDAGLPGRSAANPSGSSFNSYAETYTESEFRLPTYDEVQDLPKDPPAYEVLFEARNQEHNVSVPSAPIADITTHSSQRPLSPVALIDSSPHIICDSDEAGLLDNEVMPDTDPPPAYASAVTAVHMSTPPPTSPH